MSKLIPIALLSFFIICPAMAAEIVPILSNCGNETCQKDLAQYCSISYDFNNQPDLQNSFCKPCSESQGWGSGDNYSEPDNATNITWTQETSDGEMGNAYAQADGCTWHATCPDGTYLQRTHTTDSEGYIYDHTTCSPCNDLGAPYINKSNDTYNIEYSLTRSDTGNIKITTTCKYIYDCPVDSFGNQYTYPTTLTDDNKYIFNRICSQCAENQLVNSNKDGCITCNDGSVPDYTTNKCICNTNGYYSPSAGTLINDCAYCGDNASSYKTNTANAFYDGCQCEDGYYNKNGFNSNTYANQQTAAVDCASLPTLKYQYYSYEGEQKTHDTSTTIEPNATNITLPATDAEITKQIQNDSGYIVEGWAAADATVTWSPNDTILLGDVNYIIHNTHDFIITPFFHYKRIHYYHRNVNNKLQQLYLGNSSNNIHTCTSGTEKCIIIFDNYQYSYFKDGFYYKAEGEDNTNVTWILIDNKGNTLTDQNGNSEYKHNGSDIITYPATDVHLELKLTECPADYYCTGGIKYACPHGTTTNKETGKSSPNDCVIDDGWKICAGDYCFDLTGGLKKFTK